MTMKCFLFIKLKQKYILLLIANCFQKQTSCSRILYFRYLVICSELLFCSFLPKLAVDCGKYMKYKWGHLNNILCPTNTCPVQGHPLWSWQMCEQMQTQSLTHTHTRTRTHVRTYTHTHTHRHTLTCTRTRTHTEMPNQAHEY